MKTKERYDFKDKIFMQTNTELADIQNLFYELKHQYPTQPINFTEEPWKSMTGKEVFLALLPSDNASSYMSRFLSYLDTNRMGNLFIFHYNENAMFDENSFHQFPLSEARGLVLDMDQEKAVIVPFRKFRNLNETEEYSFDAVADRISKAKKFEISEKLDGTMISITYYPKYHQPLIATGHHLDATISVQIHLANKWYQKSPGIQKLVTDYPEDTFIFELIDVMDQHIVPYQKEDRGLRLIGIRHIATGKEIDYQTIVDVAKQYRIPTTNAYTCTSVSDLEHLMQKVQEPQKDFAKEGYVLNIDGFRVKLKYDDYVKVARFLPNNTCSFKTIVQAIVDQNIDDLISKIPMHRRDLIDLYTKQIYQYQNKKEQETTRYYRKAMYHSFDKKSFMLYTENFDNDVKKNVRLRFLEQEQPFPARYLISKHGKPIQKQAIEEYLNHNPYYSS